MTRFFLIALVMLGACEGLGTERRFQVHKCRMARDVAPSLETWQRAPLIAKECADIFRQPKCHKAYREPSGPATMIVDIVNACRADYCPLLADPKPELCAREVPDPSELGALWLPLYRRILEHELGPEGLRILDAPPDD